ncbi:hypothetical protein Talka_00810 [Tepidimonas alkaliphilus]|uniref:Uncharacterized protein n=1 Tax=Tepidimonas alkaliphilus TaxID=2588942 RepID=A0A554WA71_9BURK|nr:hypothetical protein Talka_00810 [Tepidimonas alkaliphilus]
MALVSGRPSVSGLWFELRTCHDDIQEPPFQAKRTLGAAKLHAIFSDELLNKL